MVVERNTEKPAALARQRLALGDSIPGKQAQGNPTYPTDHFSFLQDVNQRLGITAKHDQIGVLTSDMKTFGGTSTVIQTHPT
jgi:hypothetical protein